MKSAHGFDLPATVMRFHSLLSATASAALVACVLASAACAHPHPDEDESGCGAVGTWIEPATAATIAIDQLLAGLAQRPVVLLGETHDNAEHHRWQLHTLAALHGRHPNMILGFESFPRRVQPVLDQWVNGELDPAAFLEAADWTKVWGFDPSLYLPLFDFARQNRIPMIALNVDRQFVTRVRHEGWSEIPADQRFGLSDPASPALEYRKSLAQIYAIEQLHSAKSPEDGEPHHAEAESETSGTDAKAAATEGNASTNETEAAATEGHAPENGADAITDDIDIEAILESEDFARFVSAQQTWDRAMAEALAAARKQHPDALVVGILGRGHLDHGYGVPHQLADLGIPGAAVLLPIERETTCEGLPADLADAIFVIEPTVRVAAARPKPLLGVMLELTDAGVQINGVMEGSVAEQIALQKGDIVVEAAGFPIEKLADLVEIVQRQAPGTWLPLIIRRGDEKIDFVAKFPTVFETHE